MRWGHDTPPTIHPDFVEGLHFLPGEEKSGASTISARTGRGRGFAVAAALLLAACGRGEPTATVEGGGAALEASARARGLVADAVERVGVFRTENDRLCLAPGKGGTLVGASVDYGQGQRCVARGSATGGGDLDVDFGGGCRFTARLDPDRLAFPAVIPEACARACSGRASLAAIRAERLSASAAEARQVRGADGDLLCTG